MDDSVTTENVLKQKERERGECCGETLKGERKKFENRSTLTKETPFGFRFIFLLTVGIKEFKT